MERLLQPVNTRNKRVEALTNVAHAAASLYLITLCGESWELYKHHDSLLNNHGLIVTLYACIIDRLIGWIVYASGRCCRVRNVFYFLIVSSMIFMAPIAICLAIRINCDDYSSYSSTYDTITYDIVVFCIIAGLYVITMISICFNFIPNTAEPDVLRTYNSI